MEINKNKGEDYFKHRQVNSDYYSEYKIPRYLRANLPQERDLSILDIGCGLGQQLLALRQMGYVNLKGIDINDQAILECRKKGLDVEKIEDISGYNGGKHDIIFMSHVLEHIEKSLVIETLAHIKKHLLKDKGIFLLMVPNAQSNTGAYWMYEDFTHHTLFTAGSLNYVLSAAGFDEVTFLDQDGTDYMKWWKKPIIKTLLKYYKLKQDFWNLVTQSSFHKPSPRIYSFELKVKAM